MKKHAMLSIKELAEALPPGPSGRPRSRGYVHAMVKAGFYMLERHATLIGALSWLSQNPGFTWTSQYNRPPKHFSFPTPRGKRAPKQLYRLRSRP